MGELFFSHQMFLLVVFSWMKKSPLISKFYVKDHNCFHWHLSVQLCTECLNVTHKVPNALLAPLCEDTINTSLSIKEQSSRKESGCIVYKSSLLSCFSKKHRINNWQQWRMWLTNDTQWIQTTQTMTRSSHNITL